MTALLECAGHCPTCDRDVIFVAAQEWLRDYFACSSCGSIPRERALMLTIERHYPDWRGLRIHESSPGGRGASVRLARECPGYVASQYFSGQPSGGFVDGVRCEDLEALSFADGSLDLHVTQDVLEHVFHPERVFREIARTLAPGGAHIGTVPLVHRERPSRRRARLAQVGEAGPVVHLEPPAYHDNPLTPEGSLVTFDWGYDICQRIFDASGLFTEIVWIDDLFHGIRAEYIEVLVTRKPGTVGGAGG